SLNSAPSQNRKRLFNWSQSTDSLYVCSANNCNTGKEVVSGVSAPLSPHIVAKTSFIPSFLLAVNAASLVAKSLPYLGAIPFNVHTYPVTICYVFYSMCIFLY